MSARAERIASVLLATAIGVGLALALVHWVDLSLADTTAHAALVALPARTVLSDLVRRWRLGVLRRELRYTLDEIAWTEEDIQEVLPRQLRRYKRHAQLVQARIDALEAQA